MTAKPRASQEHDVEVVEAQLIEEVKMLTDEEKEIFFSWIMGKTLEPPKVVKSVISNLATKINAVTGYLTSMNLVRMNRISEFMAEAEAEIYSTERIQNMSTEELSKLYESAQRVLSTSMDFARKFIYQNKDTKNTDVDELYETLLSLPPDTIKDLQALIDEKYKGRSSSEQ